MYPGEVDANGISINSLREPSFYYPSQDCYVGWIDVIYGRTDGRHDAKYEDSVDQLKIYTQGKNLDGDFRGEELTNRFRAIGYGVIIERGEPGFDIALESSSVVLQLHWGVVYGV